MTCLYTLSTQLIIQERRIDASSSTWTVSYYGHDGLGSTRALYDASGVATDTYNYTAYGKMMVQLYVTTQTQQGPQGTPTVNNYLFAGEQWDPDLKLYYNRARYLNVDGGRFTSRDTFDGGTGDTANLHRYLYVGCDPVNNTDPTGNQEFTLGGVLVNASIGFSIGTVSTAVANHALGRAQTLSSILTGGAFGAVLGPAAVLIPEIGIGAGIFGIYGPGSVAWEVFRNPNATALQKAEAVTLVVASIWGTSTAIKYASGKNVVAGESPQGSSGPKVPDFPLPLEAPDGIILESAQSGLDSTKINQLPYLIEDMVAGKPVADPPMTEYATGRPSSIPRIAGYKDGNRYIINEGNHRMTAALEYFKATGDSKYVNELLRTGIWHKPYANLRSYRMTQ